MAALIVAWRLIELTLFMTAAAGAGSIVMRSFGFDRIAGSIPGAAPLFSLSVGLGALAYSILAIGLLGLLHVWVIWALILTLGGLSLFVGRDLFWRQAGSSIRCLWVGATRLPFPFLLVLLATGAMAALNLAAALSPPLGIDDLSYHFIGPQRYLEAHKIVFIPDAFLTSLPFTMEMLWTVAIGMDSGELAQVINWSLGLIALFWIALIGRHAGLRLREITIAVALYYSISTITHVSETGVIEFGATVFILACVFGLLNWQREYRLRWLALAAVLMAFYAGSKLPHVLALIAFSGWVFGAGWWHSRSFRRATEWAFAFGIISTGVVGIWYVKNWAMSGNPVYPFFPSELGGPPIRAELLGPGEITFSDSWFRSILHVENPIWRLFFHLYRLLLDPGKVRGHISPMFLSALPFVIAMVFRSRSRMRTILAFALLLYLIWVPTTFFIRTGFPVLALMSIPVAAVVFELADRDRFLKLTMAVLVGMWIATSMLNVLRNTVPTLPVVVGYQSTDDYLLTRGSEVASDSFVFYDAMRYMNRELPPDARVLLWDSRGYYMERPYIFAFEFIQTMADPARIYDTETVMNELRRFGITHVAMNQNSRRLQLRQTLEDTGQLNCLYQGRSTVVCALMSYPVENDS